jgi:hypothetical protein
MKRHHVTFRHIPSITEASVEHGDPCLQNPLCASWGAGQQTAEIVGMITRTEQQLGQFRADLWPGSASLLTKEQTNAPACSRPLCLAATTDAIRLGAISFP